MNGCFTMGFLETDLEMETGLQSLRDAPACVGRQDGAERKRALNSCSGSLRPVLQGALELG